MARYTMSMYEINKKAKKKRTAKKKMHSARRPCQATPLALSSLGAPDRFRFPANPSMSLERRLRISIFASSSSHSLIFSSLSTSAPRLPVDDTLDDVLLVTLPLPLVLVLVPLLLPLKAVAIFGADENRLPTIPLLLFVTPWLVSGRTVEPLAPLFRASARLRLDASSASRGSIRVLLTKSNDLSRGPALVCGRRGVATFLLGPLFCPFAAPITLPVLMLPESLNGAGVGGTSSS